MIPLACEKALELLAEGWCDGLDRSGVRTVSGHLAQCARCAAVVRDWFAADAAVAEFSEVLDRAQPRASIAERVHERITGEQSRSSRAGEEAELARFVERLRHDAVLRQRLLRVAHREAMVELLVALGAEAGSRFTVATVKSVLTRRQAANDGELSDDQLEMVAGGSSPQFGWLQELLDAAPPNGSA